MARRQATRPTDGELEILRVLWAAGPCTVRQVHRALLEDKSVATAFNTTLKLMQIMRVKALVLRDDANRPHVYRAAVAEQQSQQNLVRDFLQRVFGGSAQKMMAALAPEISPRELRDLRAMLAQHKGTGQERGGKQ